MMTEQERRACVKEVKGRFMGGVISGRKLLSKNEILICLDMNGRNERALTLIRDRNEDMFGADLMCHIPISDGSCLGIFLVPVKEGFLVLPYDAVDQYQGELITIKEAQLLDRGDLHFLLKDIETVFKGLARNIREAIKVEKRRKVG